MRFLKRPGFIAASALLVLLVLSFVGVPFDVPVAWVTRVFIAPVAELFASPVSDDAKEKDVLLGLVQSLAGDRVLDREKKRQEDDNAMISEWALARALPPPVVASMLTRIHEGANDFFLLDRGKRDGIIPYATVVTGKGILVGRIAKTQFALSFLRPLTSRGERFSVTREGDMNVLGIAEGQGSADTLLVSFVPRAVTIQKNDIITTSGLDDGVPAGLPLGVVVDAVAFENSPWQNLTIRPFVSLSSIRRVGILLFSDEKE